MKKWKSLGGDRGRIFVNNGVNKVGKTGKNVVFFTHETSRVSFALRFA